MASIYQQVQALDALQRQLDRAKSRQDIEAVYIKASTMRGAEAARIASTARRLVALMQAARI